MTETQVEARMEETREGGLRQITLNILCGLCEKEFFDSIHLSKGAGDTTFVSHHRCEGGEDNSCDNVAHVVHNLKGKSNYSGQYLPYEVLADRQH